jgi:hypothetical protein
LKYILSFSGGSIRRRCLKRYQYSENLMHASGPSSNPLCLNSESYLFCQIRTQTSRTGFVSGSGSWTPYLNCSSVFKLIYRYFLKLTGISAKNISRSKFSGNFFRTRPGAGHELFQRIRMRIWSKIVRIHNNDSFYVPVFEDNKM